jgi:hypothetical protein
LDNLPFQEIWCCDFEFNGADGEIPTPVCMVAIEARSGRTIRLWRNELVALTSPPFETGPDALFVAYFASAEIGCFLALGWEPPVLVLDLFTEFRAETNGLSVAHGNGLLGALAYFGLPMMGGDEKTTMRNLILGGGPWSRDEQGAILDYCQEDVDALLRLFPVLVGRLATLASDKYVRLGQALLRGRFMTAVARMEYVGVPIDIGVLERLGTNWDSIKLALISEVNIDYGVFDDQTFKANRFDNWLARNGIPWPRLPTGRLALDDDTFRQMARAFPEVAPLRELRHALGTLRLNKLQVGADGRNRCLLSPFSAKTGRNQPSSAKFIFGPSRWLRGLIKPRKGYGIAYLDFGSQEIAIAAALSGDPAMIDAYISGDPYLSFAVQAGLAPAHATKETHKAVRNRCKAIVLGVGYGMGAESMAYRAGLLIAEARELLRRHRETYRVFWCWADNNVNIALAGGELRTVYGWPLRCGAGIQPNPRSLLNFPMQANGAEMLRLAACMATEAGLRVCAPIHDALLLEAPLKRLDEDVARTKDIMVAASEMVLKSLQCRVDAEIVRYPDRYQDEAGVEMWNRVMNILESTEAQARDQQ